MIKLSVCIPMFRAQHIGWLPMEALCRQEDIDFEWELLVAEELNDTPFGKDRIKEYRDRLSDVGCVGVTYLGLKKWVPLSQKYNLFAERCSDTSKIYCGCAADLYPPPSRLRIQYDFFTTDPDLDWAVSGRTVFYDIPSEKTFLHDLFIPKIRKNDGSNRAVRMEIMRNLPVVNRKSGVDGWIWQEAQKYLKTQGKKFKTILDKSDSWKYGLNTQGLNNISHHRTSWFHTNIGRPDGIVQCPIDISETMPSDIMEKLRGCKVYAKSHRKGLPR